MRKARTNIGSLLILASLLVSCAGGIDDPNLQPSSNPYGNVTVLASDPANDATEVPVTAKVRITFSHLIDRASLLDTNIEIMDENRNRLSPEGAGSFPSDGVPNPYDPSQLVDQAIISAPNGYWTPGKKYIISLRNASDAGASGIKAVSVDGNPPPIFQGDSIVFTTSANPATPRRGSYVRIQSRNVGELIGHRDGDTSSSIFDFVREAIVTQARPEVEVTLSESVYHLVHDAANPLATSDVTQQRVCLSGQINNCHSGVIVGSIDSRQFTSSDFFIQFRNAAASGNAQDINNFIHTTGFNPVPGWVLTQAGRRTIKFIPDPNAILPDNDPNSNGPVQAIVLILRGWASQDGYRSGSQRPLFSGFSMGGTPILGFSMIGFIHFSGWSPALGHQGILNWLGRPN